MTLDGLDCHLLRFLFKLLFEIKLLLQFKLLFEIKLLLHFKLLFEFKLLFSAIWGRFFLGSRFFRLLHGRALFRRALFRFLFSSRLFL